MPPRQGQKMLRRRLPEIRLAVTRLLRDTKGATAIFMAVGLVPMLGMLGFSIDASLAFLTRARLAKALDVAALAAGRSALSNNAEAIARGYFDANFGNSVTVTVTSFTFALDEAKENVTLTASASVPTYFMKLLGTDKLDVNVQTVVRRSVTGLELALVLDNTGSMWGPPFEALKASTLELIAGIYGTETEIENLWISIVPYTAMVNIGPHHTDWLAPTDRVLTSPGDFSTDGWKGCVMAQTMPIDTDDTPPGDAPLTSFFYPPTVRVEDNNWPPILPDYTLMNDMRGPNLGCPTPITPLTSDRSAIEAGLQAMAPWHRGGTMGNLGLTWGWRTISPRWRGLWGTPSEAHLPLDYNTPSMRKVVIVMTDGNNYVTDNDKNDGVYWSDFTAYGRNSPGRNEHDHRMKETCKAMKAEGIEIISVVFGGAVKGPPPDAKGIALFKSCASSPSLYYYAPKRIDLSPTFRDIAGVVSSLRIVK